MSSFYNISNHPSTKWTKDQLDHANMYGEVIDFGFPYVNSSATTNEIICQARAVVDDIIGGGRHDNIIAMVQGEMTITLAIVHELQAHGVTCVAACSDRVSEEVVNADGTTSKRSIFKFVQFREYPTF